MKSWLTIGFGALLWSQLVWSLEDHNYRLVAMQIADNTFVVFGSTEHFSIRNGGNIVNTAFIVTDAGVLVIDTGPTALYGQQLRDLIEKTASAPIVRVYNTHHHPDHFFGNSAFADIPIVALADTRQAMEEQAEAFSDNLYRLLGTWMKGTLPHLPAESLVPGVEMIGGHTIETFALGGHTRGDLVILDRTTGVLFVGDVVFNQRAPTTPNADLEKWLASISVLKAVEFKLLVPGHGPATESQEAIRATSDYLRWLQSRIDEAVLGGRSMAETLFLPVPKRFHEMDTLTDEYRRSVMHVFLGVEHNMFHATD